MIALELGGTDVTGFLSMKKRGFYLRRRAYLILTFDGQHPRIDLKKPTMEVGMFQGVYSHFSLVVKLRSRNEKFTQKEIVSPDTMQSDVSRNVVAGTPERWVY